MSELQAHVAVVIDVTFDVPTQPLGGRGTEAGQQAGEGRGLDAGKGSEVNSKYDERDSHVDGHVMVEEAQHRAPRQFNEYENKAKEDGQTSFEHDELLWVRIKVNP